MTAILLLLLAAQGGVEMQNTAYLERSFNQAVKRCASEAHEHDIWFDAYVDGPFHVKMLTTEIGDYYFSKCMAAAGHPMGKSIKGGEK